MAKKHRKKSVVKPGAKTAEFTRTTPETEAKFPSYLHPIIQCKKSVLTLSRIEFYGGIVFSAVVWVLPVSGVTRSLILFFALVPLMDVVWRSPWSHAWARVSKVRAVIILIGVYLAIATSMILHDHGSAAMAVKTYIVEHVERSIKWVYVLAGALGYYLTTKLFILIKSYARQKRAGKIAARQKVMESSPGWLDYRLDAESSSRELHALVARMSRVVRWMALIFKRSNWFIGKDEKGSPIARTQGANWFLAFVLNKSSERLEPDLDELESNADLFISSTEGHLRMATKQGDLQIAELFEYFQAQLKDIREITNALSQFPPTFSQVKGTSRELNAAIDRAVRVWKTQIDVLRKLEGHCARMVRLTRAGFERIIEKPLKKLASALVETVETIVEREEHLDPKLQDTVDKMREIAKETGIETKPS